MNRVFDITAFGAVGDGQTDCTAAIQEALDAARDAGGGVVEVPPGVYATGKLRMNGLCMTLRGQSGWGYHSKGLSVFILNDPEADCLLDISGACGCTIIGMSFDGLALGENVHGVKLYWEKYNGNGREDTLTVDDCRVAGFTGDGLHFEHVWAYTVRHTMMIFNEGAGLYYDGWDVFVSDCIFNGNGRGGIRSGNTGSSGTYTANRIEWNNQAGIVIGGSDSLSITGNFFDRNFGPGVDLGEEDRGVLAVTVTGNVFRRNGAINQRWKDAEENPDLSCHVRLRHSTNVVVVGNTMRTGKDDGGGGTLTPPRSFLLEDCDHCIIKDNSLHWGHSEQAVELRGDCSTCVIEGNIGDPMPV